MGPELRLEKAQLQDARDFESELAARADNQRRVDEQTERTDRNADCRRGPRAALDFGGTRSGFEPVELTIAWTQPYMAAQDARAPTTRQQAE